MTSFLRRLYTRIKKRFPRVEHFLKKFYRKIFPYKEQILSCEILQDSDLNFHVEPVQDQDFYRKVFNKIKNENLDLNCLDIAFIVPEPIKGSGGHRNFYRAIKQLRDFGHTLTVYYMQTREPAKSVKEKVSKWFYDMGDIPFICYEGVMGFHDVGVATWWETAYMLNDNADKIQHRFYFVQDFEPYFSPVSTDYILAENSYRLGLTHICSGPWCKEFLVNKFHAEADFFRFPVDRSIYNIDTPRTKENKNIIFFAKPEMPRRCYWLGVMILKIFHELKPDVEIIMFGSNEIDEKSIPFPVTVKKLLPTLHDLALLYRNADLGLVFSTTNPSLVPYEMMACGCPVADIDWEYSIHKYGGNLDNVFLFDPQPKIFAKELAEIIDNTSLLNQKGEAGRRWVEKEFYTEFQMAKKVESIIKTKITTGQIR